MRIVLFLIATLLLSCGESPPDDPNTPVIVLSRHGCYGRCPVYDVSVYFDGKVFYELRSPWWSVSTSWNNHISKSDVEGLIAAFHAVGFLDMDTPKGAVAPVDAATSTLTFNWRGTTKSIRYWHRRKELESLAEKIDQIAGTKLAQDVLAEEVKRIISVRSQYASYSIGMITLDRIECSVPCPLYTITIQSDGKVVWHGRAEVKTIGEQVDWIDSTLAKSLIRLAIDAEILSIADSAMVSDIEITDRPRKSISLTLDQESRSIEIGPGVPARIAKLEGLIDSVANTSRWVKGYGPMQ